MQLRGPHLYKKEEKISLLELSKNAQNHELNLSLILQIYVYNHYKKLPSPSLPLFLLV